MENEQASIYRRWNPTELDDICGNKIAVAKCRKLIDDTVPSKRPGFMLITGPFGTGKSTLAHILLKEFGCGDIQVFNSRKAGKIDFVTEFLTNMLPNPSLFSGTRGFIFEEAHAIQAGSLQMMLEPLEKSIPVNTYVLFVTNSPELLTTGKGALLSRPFRIDTVAIKPADMIERLEEVNGGDLLGLTDLEIGSCAKAGHGSMRTALNHMAQLASVPSDFRKDELNRINMQGGATAAEFTPDLKDMANAIATGDWNKVAPLLKRLRGEGVDPEGMRRGLLAWYSGTLLSENQKCKDNRVFSLRAIDALRDNYYSSGFPGLVGDVAHLMRTGIKRQA